ncbi:MAG: hypothetical protein LBH44_03205 [Treponema sp.]|jgi:hypothetical protein|nr:hypothetical protein [Treponema sp.]
MKRNILAIIFILCVICAYGQNSTPIDLILLLDTSTQMSTSYEKVTDYMTGTFLSDFLRIGDTFHLIAFSGNTRVDVVRRVESRGDVETIIGRMLLQYPLESGNDARAAIAFTEEYIAALPTRPKKMVMVTGGVDSALVNAAKQRLNARNTTLDLVLVTPDQPLVTPPSGRVPRPASQTPAAGVQQSSPGTTAPTQPTASGTSTQQTQASSSTAQTQATTPGGQQDGTGTQATTTPSTNSSQTQSASSATSQTQAAASGTGTSQTQPDVSGSQTRQDSTGSIDSSSQDAPAASSTEDAGKPADGQPSKKDKPAAKTNNENASFPMPLLIGFTAAALLALVFLIFFVTRNLRKSPDRVIAMAASSENIRKRETVRSKESVSKSHENVSKSNISKSREKVDKAKNVEHSNDLASFAAVQHRQRTNPYSDRSAKLAENAKTVINPSGPLILNLFVEDQNTAIGKRNIHSLKSGYSLSVGGGNSDFLVFLVPVPAKIGEIRRDGSQLTFIPRKPKYFPDLGSGELRDCINKTIRIVSDKNYELRARFELYEDPLIALNRMLNSLNVPG